MDDYIFTYETKLRHSLEETWSFFSDPKNLEKVNKFPPVQVDKDGHNVHVRIPYTGKVGQFTTEIMSEVPPHFFIDKMVNPPFPFTYWEHKHEFVKGKDGTVMIDQVRFRAKVPASMAAKILQMMFSSRAHALRKRINM
ncbi:hypothetical protein ABC345_08325 [Shouchella sp. 1P09AA]|uniref:hypothetical protein n=1 Tax=unclassified Shouchella TaxID=2893065 RepID=UPI0039A33AF5